MKNNKYTFGDVTFEFDSPYELKDKNGCSAFLSEREADYIIKLIPTEMRVGREEQFERNGSSISVFVERKYAAAQSIVSLLTFCKAEALFPEHDAFILHASYIIRDGAAILFTAPSGTGKSTQARLWQNERGAEIVNGDRVLITRRNGTFYANGIYVCGTSGICRNRTAPIAAVVLLEQGTENEECKIPPRKLFLRILCECSYDMHRLSQYEKVTGLLSELISTLPTVCFRCKKSPDSVEALERILWKKA